MIEYINYFFRHNEDGYTNMPINMIRIAMLLGLLFAIKTKNKEKFIKPLLILGVTIQCLLFTWYLGNKKILLVDGLPLYHCRIAAIMMTITYFTKKQMLAKFFGWMGVIGAITVLLIPDASPFIWPHVTNVTFVGSHLLLLITGSMIILTTDKKLDFRQILKYTFNMNLFLLIVNFICGSNYGYLMRTPEMMNLDLPMPVLFFTISLLISMIIGISESFSVKVSKRRFSRSFVN